MAIKSNVDGVPHLRLDLSVVVQNGRQTIEPYPWNPTGHGREGWRPLPRTMNISYGTVRKHAGDRCSPQEPAGPPFSDPLKAGTRVRIS
jgi:hypothetical protein